MMMNDLFHDIINQGNMATFINDIIIATEIKKEHDEIVEKVLKQFKKNDLFVKLEKC